MQTTQVVVFGVVVVFLFFFLHVSAFKVCLIAEPQFALILLFSARVCSLNLWRPLVLQRLAVSRVCAGMRACVCQGVNSLVAS